MLLVKSLYSDIIFVVIKCTVLSSRPIGLLQLDPPTNAATGPSPAQRRAATSHTHTHTHPFNGPLSGTTRVSQCQKGEANLDFSEARDSEWQWHQLGHMQVCTSLQTDNHTSTPPLSFLQAGCPSCRPTNSVKALKAPSTPYTELHIQNNQTVITAL